MSRNKWLGIGILGVGAVAVALSACGSVSRCHGAGHDHGRATAHPSPGAAVHPATSRPAAKFVNVRCPIMGGTIDPDKVTDALTREYKGQKVAFCCGGCPAAWDKLSDAEKDKKLEAAGKAGDANGKSPSGPGCCSAL